MITAERLRELLIYIPSDVKIVAYEGEGVGLRVLDGEKSGWIETNGDDDVPADESKHRLTEFREGPL